MTVFTNDEHAALQAQLLQRRSLVVYVRYGLVKCHMA